MIDVTHIRSNQKLLKYVKNICVFESKQKIKYKHKLLPSAYTYLSYNHKDIPVSFFETTKVHPKGRLQIAGPKLNKDINVEYDGKLSQILIEFTASGFYYLFHQSPSKLTNRLSDLNIFILPGEYNQLRNKLYDLDKVEDQVNLLEEFLIERSYNALPFSDYIERSLKYIEENFGNVPIKRIVDIAGIGKRQFDRKFHEIVGVTPKYYSKIIRLKFVINLMCSKKYASIKDIAYRAKYYDLSHFEHRFKNSSTDTTKSSIQSCITSLNISYVFT